MKNFLLSLLFTGCATNIAVPPLPAGHPAQAETASANSPRLRPYLASHRSRVAQDEEAAAPKEDAPMDHSKMKMEGM